MVRIALVTGASSGIGAATALALAKRGFDVVVNYRSNEDGAKRVVQQIESMGRRAVPYRADVTVWSEVEAMMSFVRQEFGGLDAVIANAGGLPQRRTLLESDLDYWRSIIDLNLTSAYITARLAVPVMRSGSALIFVSSVAARNGGGRGAFAYAAAKAGLLGLTRALSKELAPSGIRVIAVLPGLVDTPFHEKASTGDIHEWARQVTHLRRVGRPEEIGEVIAFLASEATYITGAFIEVDGGWY